MSGPIRQTDKLKMLKYGLKIKQKFRTGVILAELIIAIAVSVIPVSLIAVLLVSGHYNWHQTYSAATREIEIDAQNTITVFGRIGRKSDRTNTLIDSVDQTTGQIVEFRYWADTLGRSSTPSNGIEPDEYARFYLDIDKKELRVDYGRNPYGNRRISKTIVLANNVTDVRFSRTIANNCRQAGVSMELTLIDPADGEVFIAKTVVLMRN